MGRVKIKHPYKSDDAKKKLLEVFSNQDVYAIDVHEARDGYIVITSTDEEIDIICSPTCTTRMRMENFSPVLPPQLKAKRTILLFRTDPYIYDNETEEIKQEISAHNEFADGEIEMVFKFPRAKIIKVMFKQAATATKACEQGLKLFQMKIPHYNIKREEYIPINVCYKCYKLDDHNSNQCPQDANYMVCSECSRSDHTWANCKSTNKLCLNCKGDHRTLAFKCPLRKQLVEKKKNEKPQSYAAAANTTNSNPLPQIMNQKLFQDTENPRILFQKIMSCFVHAHINNAIAPGTFGKTLNESLKTNGLAEFIAPNCPDSSQLYPNMQMTNESEDSVPNQDKPTPIIEQTHSRHQAEASTDDDDEKAEEDSDYENSEDSSISVEPQIPQTTRKPPTTTKRNPRQRITRLANSHFEGHVEHVTHQHRPTYTSDQDLTLQTTQTHGRKNSKKKQRQ